METLNTLQLEKVDCNYIKKVLDSMNKKYIRVILTLLLLVFKLSLLLLSSPFSFKSIELFKLFESDEDPIYFNMYLIISQNYAIIKPNDEKREKK